MKLFLRLLSARRKGLVPPTSTRSEPSADVFAASCLDNEKETSELRRSQAGATPPDPVLQQMFQFMFNMGQNAGTIQGFGAGYQTGHQHGYNQAISDVKCVLENAGIVTPDSLDALGSEGKAAVN